MLAGDVAVYQRIQFERDGVKQAAVFEHTQVRHVVLVLLLCCDGFHQSDQQFGVFFAVEVVEEQDVFFLVVELAVYELFGLLNFLDVLQE